MSKQICVYLVSACMCLKIYPIVFRGTPATKPRSIVSLVGSVICWVDDDVDDDDHGDDDNNDDDDDLRMI